MQKQKAKTKHYFTEHTIFNQIKKYGLFSPEVNISRKKPYFSQLYFNISLILQQFTNTRYNQPFFPT